MDILNSVSEVKSRNCELTLRNIVMSNTDDPVFAKCVSELISSKPLRKRKHYIKSGNLRKDLRKLYGINLDIAK